MTELQEINEDIRICEAQVIYYETCSAAEWLEKEVDSRHRKIEVLAEEIADVTRKNAGATKTLHELDARMRGLKEKKMLITGGPLQRLLKLQEEIEELQGAPS